MPNPRRFGSFAVIVLIAGLIIGGCSGAGSVKVPRAQAGQILRIDSKQGRALLDSDRRVLLLDVRTVREYIRGHLVGAQNVDMSDENAWQFRVAEFDPDGPTVLYCRDADCSNAAAQRLVDAGFTEVYDLGYPEQWDSGYLPIDKRGKS